jgi:hypothetical protein
MNTFMKVLRMKAFRQVSMGIAIAMAVSGMGLSQTSSVTAKPTRSVTQTTDNSAIAGLVAHLNKIEAKMYGAYWCPHCTRQKKMFGDDIFRTMNYIECDPKGADPKPDLCRAAKIQGYPTWEIKGKLYPGTQSLEELAKLSGYQGNTKF